MVQTIRTIKFKKNKNGEYFKSGLNNKIPENPEVSKKSEHDYQSIFMDIDDIYQKLAKQKQEERTNEQLSKGTNKKQYSFNDLFYSQPEVFKSDKPSLKFDKNKLMIHQYNYDSKLSKIHEDIRKNLFKLVDDNGYLLNHILLYGLNGSGKHTLALSLLYDTYGNVVNNRKYDSQVVEKRTLKYISNKYYCEILVNNYVLNDNYTLMSFIQKFHYPRGDGRCQYIIIKNFDELTAQCQKTILHTMEKIPHIRFILTVKRMASVINGIKSYCHQVRVPRPDMKTLAKFLNKLAKFNDLNISHQQIEYIVRSSECNITQSINALEKSCININNTYVKTKDIHNKYIAEILQLSTGPSMENARAIRNLISQLIITTYDVGDVYKRCVKLFLNSKYDMNIKDQVIKSAAKFSLLNERAHSDIFALEAFFMDIMRIINSIGGSKKYSLQKNNFNTKSQCKSVS